jgi:hypothetical protein
LVPFSEEEFQLLTKSRDDNGDGKAIGNRQRGWIVGLRSGIIGLKVDEVKFKQWRLDHESTLEAEAGLVAGRVRYLQKQARLNGLEKRGTRSSSGIR